MNSAEDIKEAFEPYYEETVLLEETDPNVIYDIKNTLDNFRVYQSTEVEHFAKIFYSPQAANSIGKLQSTIRPALDRFDALEEERQEVFKTTLNRFNRIYSFITQVCRLFDREIHKFSVYAKFLAMQLPKTGIERVNLDDKILLEYYRLEKDYEGSIVLEGSEGGFKPITGDTGRGEKKKDPLTVLIDEINKKYGTNFTEMDKVLLQLENDYASQERWQAYAKETDFNDFMLLFKKDFPNMVMKRYEQNDKFFVKMLDDDKLLQDVMKTLGRVLYERLKEK